MNIRLCTIIIIASIKEISVPQLSLVLLMLIVGRMWTQCQLLYHLNSSIMTRPFMANVTQSEP